MSEINNVSCPMTEYYPDIYNWNGVMMDAASYAKHQQHSESAPEPDASPAKESADALDDIFDAPQDLRQIAADAIQEDTVKESCDTICAWQTQTHQLLLEAPKYLRVGSGFLSVLLHNLVSFQRFLPFAIVRQPVLSFRTGRVRTGFDLICRHLFPTGRARMPCAVLTDRIK